MALSVKKKAPSESKLGRLELLVEDMSSQIKTLAEVIVQNNDSLRREIRDLRTELISRIEVLESVVRQNSRDIAQNSRDIAALRDEVAELRKEVRAAASENALTNLETRVSKLESQLASTFATPTAG